MEVDDKKEANIINDSIRTAFLKITHSNNPEAAEEQEKEKEKQEQEQEDQKGPVEIKPNVEVLTEERSDNATVGGHK